MKRLGIVLLALIMTFQMFGCAAKETETVGTLQSETVNYSYEGQEELLNNAYDTWKMGDDYCPWFYAFTDMDHNGRMEVITAVCQGTGLYTTAYYYEINEEKNGIQSIDTNLTEGYQWPDIITDTATCYYDSTDGSYYYIYEDLVKNGAAEQYIYEMSVCLKDGAIKTQTLAHEEILSDITETGTTSEVTYYDADGNVINEEKYSEAVTERFSGMEKGEKSFTWNRVEAEISREPNLIFAEDLYDGYGYIHQLCDETGVYDFSSINSDGVTWQVYILDKEFEDAERFIPQAYSCALSGDGSLSIKEGQWIYIYCPCNSWTMTAAPERCAFSWGINPDKQYGDAPIPSAAANTAISTAADSIVITKSPTSEALTIGGNTWFIAHADNALSIEWLFEDPNGLQHNVEETMSQNPGLLLEVLEGDTIAVSNVPESLNGWSVKALFSGNGPSACTDSATIYVGNFTQQYTPVIEEYKMAYASGIPSYEYAVSKNISVYTAYSSHVGYALKDLDKNGIPELLVAGTGEGDYSDKVIYAAYTLENNQVIKLFESRERVRYYLMADCRIFMEGSSGAEYSDYELYKVSGSTMIFQEGYSTYNDIDEPGDAIYYSTVMGQDGYVDYSNYSSKMSLDEGMAAVSALQSGKWVPGLTLIA